MSTAVAHHPPPQRHPARDQGKGRLYAAYIPLFADGGVFIPTTRDYKLGDDVYVLLSLPDDPQRYPVAGKVAWVTPARAAANRTQGVGVRFPADEKVAPAEDQDRRDPGRPPGLRAAHADHLKRYNFCSSLRRCQAPSPALSPHVRRFALPPDASPNWLRKLPADPAGHGAGAGGPGAVHLHHAGRVRRGPCAGHAIRQLLGHRGRAPRQRRRDRTEPGRIWSSAPPVRGWWPSARPGWTTTRWMSARAAAPWPTWSGSASAFAPISARRGRWRKPLVIHTRAASADTLAHPEGGGRGRLRRVRRRGIPLLHRNRRGRPRRAGPGLLHLVLGHPDLQERPGLARCRGFRAAGPAADRDRQPLSGARAVPRQDQQPFLCAVCGTPDRRAAPDARRRGGACDQHQFRAPVSAAPNHEKLL